MQKKKEMNARSITGTIKVDNEIITFVCEDYRFTFVRSGNDLGAIIMPLEIKTDPNGYIWGTTHNDNPIAIFVKNSLTIQHTIILSTWNYIVFKAPIENSDTLFNGIRFLNGGIKAINPCSTLQEDFEKEGLLNKEDDGHYYVYRANAYAKNIDIELNGCKSEWLFGTMVNSKRSFEDGTSLRDDTSLLEIYFDEPQSLAAFYKFYGYVSTLVSFMTFRSNTFFESIMLMKRDEAKRAIRVADCYVKTVEDCNTRKLMNSISVYYISDDCFRTMVYNIAQNDRKHCFLPIDIIPKNDSDFGVLDKDRIRNICSSLEVEMDLAKISVSRGGELKQLIDGVKELINESRNNKEIKIPESTYNNIFNSIGHWGDTVADRAIVAWDDFYCEVAQLMMVMGITLDQDTIHENIRKFIKTRNQITHEGFNELDKNLALTAILLSALVYCLTMTRLGFDKKQIADLMARRLIG